MKYMPGFVPINFNLAGKILFLIGFVCIFLRGIAYLTGWTAVPNILLYLGLGLIVIGCYLIFVVPKQKF